MKKIIIVCSALALSPVVTIHAQQRSSLPNLAPRVYERLNWTTPLEGKVVIGQPYSAEVVSETVQTLADGNRIVQRTTGRVYRDGQGRVRREEDRPAGPPSISIFDATNRVTYTLDSASRVARETPNVSLVLSQLGFNLQRANVDAAKLSLNGVVGGVARGPGGRGFIIQAGRTETEEKLPDQVIEGVLASGIRRTTTFAKGAIGNEQPIKIASEEWTSPDLQVLVLTDHTDPRTGRSTYRLLRINRTEPDPSLFQVPPDYTVQRGAGPGGRGAGPGLAPGRSGR